MKAMFKSSHDDGSPTAWFDRFSPIPGLLITTCVCCTLLVLQVSGFRGSEDAFMWVRANRTWVGIAVQLVSHILGIIYIQVLCAVLRTSFVLSLSERPFPIYLAHFFQAASTPRMTWALPWRFCLPLVLIVAASLLPAALWAGAVTPLASERNTTQLIDIPSFDASNTSAIWDGDSSTAVSGGFPPQWMTDTGLFSFDPSSLRGSLLASAAEASSLTGNTAQHAKLDRTGYNWINRSFGMGAVAGFTSFLDIQSPSWYSYEEQGFSSTISCRYNDTAAETLSFYVVENGTWGTVLQAIGPGPLSHSDRFTTYYVSGLQDSFAWLPQYDNNTKMLAIQMITAADESHDPWAFHQFNNIQCDLLYTPDIFDVFINISSQSIVSSPRKKKDLAWPAYGDKVIDQVAVWLWSFSYGDGCAGGCQLGRSLRLNANMLENRAGDRSNDTVLRATEDYLGSLTDNILVNLILTRLVGDAPQPTAKAQALISVPAIIIGDWTLIIAINILNLLICAIYAWESIRTRAWTGLPPFDLSNTCDIIIGATKGGMTASVQSRGQRNIADENPNTEQNDRAWKTSPWTYSDEAPLCDSTRIRMRYDPSTRNLPALVPLLEDDHESPEIVDCMDASSTCSRKSHRTAVRPLLDR